MRSYKDCLIEYVEERGFSELNVAWFRYLNQVLALGNKPFQILESFPPIDDALSLSFYADIIPANCLVYQIHESNPEKRSEVYKNLIRELLINELRKLQLRSDEQQANLRMIEDMLKYPQSKQFSNYSKAFKRYLLDSGFDKKFVRDFFMEIETDESNCFKAIENFYDLNNYYLNIPKYGIQSTTTLVGTLAVNFNSHCLYNSIENEWTEQAVIPNSSFILGEKPSLFFNINSKAKVSPVKVSGELHGIEKTEIQVGDWFNQKMIDQLFKNHNKSFDSRLEFAFQQQVKSSLEKSFKSFYSLQEYDLTIEVQNHFTDEDIELLRNNSFSLFPFHLSTQHDCYKWIDRNDAGELRIRIKSKMPQQNFFGAELEIIV